MPPKTDPQLEAVRERLTDIRERLQNATGGYWRAIEDDQAYDVVAISGDAPLVVIAQVVKRPDEDPEQDAGAQSPLWVGSPEDDAAFLACSRGDIAYLLDVADRFLVEAELVLAAPPLETDLAAEGPDLTEEWVHGFEARVLKLEGEIVSWRKRMRAATLVFGLLYFVIGIVFGSILF